MFESSSNYISWSIELNSGDPALKIFRHTRQPRSRSQHRAPSPRLLWINQVPDSFDCFLLKKLFSAPGQADDSPGEQPIHSLLRSTTPTSPGFARQRIDRPVHLPLPPNPSTTTWRLATFRRSPFHISNLFPGSCGNAVEALLLPLLRNQFPRRRTDGLRQRKREARDGRQRQAPVPRLLPWDF